MSNTYTPVNTRLTVADCREHLYAEVNPSDANDPLFIQWLNEVCERYINSGKWKGALVSTIFDSASGYITLPPHFLGVLGNRWGRWCGAGQTRSQFFSYMELGPGEMLDTTRLPGMLVDMGDGYPTQIDINQDNPGSLRIYSGGSDNGKTMRVFGIQQETGEPVYDSDGDLGEAITLNSPVVQSAYHYSAITGIQREATKGYVTMKLLPQGGGDEYLLSTYQPNETRPMYRRYQSGTFDESTDGEEARLHVICQRRFMRVVNETDWVIPGNLTALRYGLKAMYQEQRQEIDKAQAYFQQGLEWLNREAKAARGGITPDMNFSLFGTTQSFQWAN